MPPDEPNAEEKLEQLPEDYDTPFRPASKIRDDTRPNLDTGLQPEEVYDQGIPDEEPNAGNTVEGYDPAKDQRLKKNHRR